MGNKQGKKPKKKVIIMMKRMNSLMIPYLKVKEEENQQKI